MVKGDCGFELTLRRLQEAEETLGAIRAGEVDAVVVEGPNGQQVYTLESPEEPFRMFVERMQEGALTINAEGTVVYCNRFFANLVGRSLENVRGQSIYTFVADTVSQEQFRKLLKTAATGAAHGECQLRSEGNALPVQLAFNRLPAEDANMFGVVVTDLTERDRARRLEAKRQAAEQANAARDQFLAVVSHELRTPLNAILGWIQVFRKRGDIPDALHRGIEVIERNAWAQAQLINDLLDVSRVLAGKLRLELRSIELQTVIDAAIATIQPVADTKGIKVVCEPGACIKVQGDADRLQQVVWNLLSNAVKFTPEGGEVQVLLRKQGRFAEIRVSDNGIGIAADFLPRLFEFYHQIESCATRRSGGLGLGLAIVKQLTELHRGKVWAESEGEGLGATFTLRLPISVARERTGEISAPVDSARTQALMGVRVLIVEDEADGREVLVQLFENAGALVTAAVASGQEALAALERGPVDLLVSDIGLVGMDGHELIRCIRTSGRTKKDLPAIALTAFAGRDDRRRALLAGYQAHLSKPVDQDELYTVAASLAGHHVR